MFRCPRCRTSLARQGAGRSGVFWRCPECEGRAASLGFLRRNAAGPVIDEMWRAARNASPRGALPCPACERRMVEVEARSPGGSVEVDVCTPCHFIWFDAGEIEAISRQTAAADAPRTADRLSEANRRAFALMQVEHLAARHREAPAFEVWTPETPFDWFAWLFGLPVIDSAPIARQPIATYLIAIALVVCGILAAVVGGAIERYGLVPAEPWRAGGLTFFTSFFVHADPLHLIANTYFLLLVGRGSENLLGHARFVVLLAAATLAGGVAHVLVDPGSTVPCVGASGGISGVMAFFALKNPHAKVGIFFLVRWIGVPAFVALLLWIGLQLFTLVGQIEGLSNVSAAAHFGGATVGVAFWLTYRKL